jgi:hypothetical protein
MLCCWLRCCPADDPQNLKALYRRGQAYAALQQHAQAAQDLEGSLQLSGHDPQQQQLIREKLKSVREKMAAEQSQLQQDTAWASGAAAAAAKQEEDGLIEEVQEETDDEMPPLDEDVPELEVIGELPKQQQEPSSSSSRSAAAQQRAAAARGSSSSSGAAGGGGLAAMQAQAAEMMRANPDLARQVRGMLVTKQ